MVDIKISELPDIPNDLTDTDLAAVVQGSTTYKASGLRLQRNAARNLTDGAIPRRDGTGTLVDSSVMESADAVAVMKSIADTGGLTLGQWMFVNGGANIVARNTALDREFYPVAVEFDTTTGTSLPFYTNFSDTVSNVTEADGTETFTGAQIQFKFIVQDAGRRESYTFDSEAAADVTDCNLIVRATSHTTEPALFNYKRATNGTGFTLSPGDTTVTLPVPLFLQAAQEIFITIEAGSGQTLSLRGQTQTIGGTSETVPYTVISLRASATVELVTENNRLTVQDEGVDLATQATTLNFTGPGVTATGTGAIKTINITGGGGGTALTIQDEGVGLTTAADTLNFVGAGVTATGTTGTKTITIPGGNALTVQDEGVGLTTAADTINFVGAGVTATGTTGTKTVTVPGGITVQEEGVSLASVGQTLNFAGVGVTATGTGDTKTITVPGGVTVQDEGTPLASLGTVLNFVGAGVTATGTGGVKTITVTAGAGAAIPSLHNFTINIPSRVDIGTDLNNQRTVSFDVSNYSLLTALTLIVTDVDDQTLTLPIRDGVQTQTVTLSGITTTSATTITFQLSGTYAGGTVTSEIRTVTVANLQAQEQAYVGSRLTNDFATVDVATLNAFDVTAAGSVYTFTQSVNNGEFLGILSPTNRDPVSVINTTLNIDDLSRFTATTNVRTIGALSYNLLVLQNNSGFDATFSYRVTTE